MAPTKANATYTVTTLSLLAKGPMKVIGEISLVDVAARLTTEASKAFPGDKVSLAALLSFVGCAGPRTTWLKIHEINALKSP